MNKNKNMNMNQQFMYLNTIKKSINEFVQKLNALELIFINLLKSLFEF